MNDKVYLITGASSDVGMAYIKSLDQQLVKENQKALVLAHYASNAEELLKLQKEMQALELILIQADLSKAEGIQKLITDVREYCDSPDYIVHLPASKFTYMRIKQFDWELITREMEIQVHSLGELGKVFLPKMAKKKAGKIVVMLTAYTIGMPPKFMSHYLISKYALLGLMKGMAIEFADKGININGISPNMMETKFLENLDERTIEMTKEASLLKRNISLEEVVPAIHFLLSEGSNYMNGINLNLTGGDR